MNEPAAWDARYAEAGFQFGDAPNAWLRSLLPRLHRGMRALAVGDGEGRNGVWLAQQGLSVTSVDWSAAGLAKAQDLARQRGVTLATEVADLAHWAWPQGAFDVIAWIYVHLSPEERGPACAGALHALAPGGLLVLEGFSPAQQGRRSGGPKDPALLWTRDRITQHFAGLEVLELLEGTVLLDEGPRHQGHAEIVRAVLRRPIQPGVSAA